MEIGTSVELIPFDKNLEAHCRISAEWMNDSRIRHLFTFADPETGEFTEVTPQDIQSNYAKGRLSGKYFRWMVTQNSCCLGEVSLSIDPSHRITPDPQTGWISIVIGDPDHHGQGIGSQALHLLEKKALELQCRRIELGVFEFNDKAFRFYLKNGFKEVARLENYLKWDGKPWADIRMLKPL